MLFTNMSETPALPQSSPQAEVRYGVALQLRQMSPEQLQSLLEIIGNSLTSMTISLEYSKVSSPSYPPAAISPISWPVQVPPLPVTVAYPLSAVYGYATP